MNQLMRFVGIPLMAATTLLLVGAEMARERAPAGGEAGIRGAWYPHRTEQKLPGAGWKIEIGETSLAISYTRALETKRTPHTMDIVRFQTPFLLRPGVREQRVLPSKDMMGVTPMAFHLEGDRLIIDDGAVGEGISLKGEWRRTPAKD